MDYKYLAIAVIAGVVGGVPGLPALASAAGAEPAQHQGAAVPPMDNEGRRLESYQVKHHLDPATLAALRKKIALYRGMSDMQIHMNMAGMGPNYEWYASDPDLRGDVGVLILSHGVGENSDRLLKESFRPVWEKWPTAIGFGMAMMQSSQLQSAVDDLVAHGAKTIVLVPSGTTTEYNSLTRQWKYIFDLGQEEAPYLDVPKVRAKVKFVLAGHFGASPLITDILYEHAKAVSKNPANEVVIIVGHGPEDIKDNGPDLEILKPHVERLKAKNEFADVKMINLQDDAIPPVRETNVRKLRRWIKQANKRGQTPIVVPLAAASFGLQAHIRQDLRGMNYVFVEQGLSENPKYVAWVKSVIEQSLEDKKVASAD